MDALVVAMWKRDGGVPGGGALICVQHRVGNPAQHGFETDGIVLAAFTANAALHPTPSQARRGKLRLPGPGQPVCYTLQCVGCASLDAGPALGATPLIKLHLWKTAITAHQNTLGAGAKTGVTARTRLDEICLKQGPRRAGYLFWNRGGDPATQKKTTLQIHDVELLLKGKDWLLGRIVISAES